MFCRGCLGKLPAFVATGPAAIDTMRTLGHATAPRATTTTARATEAPWSGTLFESRAFWLRAAGVALTLIAFIVGWYAWVTRPAPPVGMPASAVAARTVVPEAVAGVAPAQRPLSKVVPANEALGPGEVLAPRGPAMTPSTVMSALPSFVPAPAPAPETEMPAMRQVFPQQAAQQRRSSEFEPSAQARRNASGDPRAACSGLNFVAAARCEMVQCATPAYSHHPHCNAVREQTRRDVARRDLSN